MSLPSSPQTPVVSLRVMELRDLPTVVGLHRAGLSRGFFVELGDKFLSRYYRTFLTSPAAVALIAEVDGERAGFLVGCTDAAVHHRHVIHLERWRLARAGATSLLLRPALTAKFVRTRAQRYTRGIKRARDHQPVSAAESRRVGVLSHIAVRDDLRRHGVGRILVTAFVNIAKGHGVERLELQTAADNVSAQRFYERLGWKPGAEVQDPDGKMWVSYVLEPR
jgi:ribosomal protein S18 acetylase RimI-like enzyme